ncbi:MAG TPA: hypothetical protein VMZ90_09520 [Vicinamibacterales bacterium]|nr:hypothetical protein [Vicinamibacterales bacterium]
MVKGILRMAAMAAGAAALSAFAATEPLRCPGFPIPHEGRAVWVAEDILFNGIPMQIKEYKTALTPAQVMAFYKSQWGSAPPYFHEYDVGEWKAIATLKERCFYTVQLQADGSGTRALLGISARPRDGTPPAAGAGFPTLSGSQVLNDIDHRDGGKTGRTLVVVNSYSTDMNAHFYRRTMAGEGWVPIVDRTVEGAKGLSHVMVLKRGYNEANLTIAPGQSGTSVLASFVDRP